MTHEQYRLAPCYEPGERRAPRSGPDDGDLRPGYGIHGSPEPEKIGRTESAGCFRLANWNASYLLPLVYPGLPVQVEP